MYILTIQSKILEEKIKYFLSYAPWPTALEQRYSSVAVIRSKILQNGGVSKFRSFLAYGNSILMIG